jgi:hypothetical protein
MKRRSPQILRKVGSGFDQRDGYARIQQKRSCNQSNRPCANNNNLFIFV